MSKFDRIRSAVGRVVEENGAQIVLRKTEQGAYDTATSTASETTRNIKTCAVIESFKARELGVTIQSNDVKVSIPDALLNEEPLVKDRILIDNVSHEIVDVSPIHAGPVVVWWTVAARK